MIKSQEFPSFGGRMPRMQIGVPREIKNHEYRVGLTPTAVKTLVDDGHTVTIEAGAGLGIAVEDDEWRSIGAKIASSAEEVWESELVVKVKEPLASEYPLLTRTQTLYAYLHLAAEAELTDALMHSGITAIAYETVQTNDGRLPLLAPMSEVAGKMGSQVGAHFLEKEPGGRGVLMGGATGAPPAQVVVIGAGVAGYNSTLVAAGMGASVTVLDTNQERLAAAQAIDPTRVTPVISTPQAIDALLPTADVVIGSVLIPGARAPKLVTAAHIASMPKGSVAIDIAIDQGGCFETSHVTTHSDPTYVVDGVTHYCVGNIPGAVPRTSTYALVNVTLPYLQSLAANGVDKAIQTDLALKKGVNVKGGMLVNEAVAKAHGLDWAALA
jgi:alanine dehydrogenase